ncbi:MAG: ABC transporter permease [Deltaproteobacteria bacterium]|nr:ABC transporter permease [Deltaproteobacteria bacterium]
MSRSRAGSVLLIGLRYLGNRKLATTVSMAAIALSVLLVVGVALVDFAVKKAAVEGSIRYPLIVGPEGSSSVQLIFSTIFHIDKPTGTIPFGVYESLARDERVISAYPIAVADSLMSYPIIGTDEPFLRDLGAGVAAGALDLSDHGNAVLGSEVATRAELAVGDEFEGSHGMIASEGAHVHDELTYRVVGILWPTGGPEDAAIYVPVGAVWEVHGDEHEGEAEGDHEDEDGGSEEHHEEDKYQIGEGQLTAVLVRTSNPVNTGVLERELTLKRGLQAVDTGRAIRRLVSYLNKGERLIEVLGAVTMGIAVAMILVTLVMSLSERRKELALMRCLGVGRSTISLVVMVEALAITLVGAAIGDFLGHVAVWWAAWPIKGALGVTVEPWTITDLEGFAVLTALIAGQLLALISMLWTYRMNLVEEVARD